jgi:tetratricopeptide (TPR) repeat protein
MAPLVINAVDAQYVQQLRDFSLFRVKCEFCGYDATAPLFLLYYDSSQTILWAVSVIDSETRYLLIKNNVNSIISLYSKMVSPEESDSFRKLPWQYMPLFIFLQKIGSPIYKGGNIGYIHFYPLPSISINHESFSFEPSSSLGELDDYAVSLAEGNYPDFYDTIWNLTGELLYLEQYNIRTQKLVEPPRPISTYGTPEILIYVGNAIVLPMVIGVFSSLLTSLILDKVKAKKRIQISMKEKQAEGTPTYEIAREIAAKIFKAQANDLTPSDKLKVSLRVKGECKEYAFSGSIQEVYEQLTEFRNQMLSSVRISDNCHLAMFYYDHFADSQIGGDWIRKSTDLSDTYRRIFKSSTKARFAWGKDAEYLKDAMEASEQAKSLIEKKEYDAASLFLEKFLTGEQSSIDILYNYALCQEALGNVEIARFFYEQVLVRAINLPSLEELATLTEGINPAE